MLLCSLFLLVIAHLGLDQAKRETWFEGLLQIIQAPTSEQRCFFGGAPFGVRVEEIRRSLPTFLGWGLFEDKLALACLCFFEGAQ